MLLALTGYETLLLGVAAVFIVFALVCALVIPRSKPAFPGKRLGIFVAICALLFAAQLTAVMVDSYLGEEEAEAVEPPCGRRRPPTTPPARDQTTEPEPADRGDPGAGKEVFVGSAGCAGCHTLSDAGATGTIGPDLDATMPSYEQCRRPRDERSGRHAVVLGLAERAADPGRRGLRLVRSRRLSLADRRVTSGSLERCPSGLRSATGNRVRAERCVAGSNPALSVT